MRSLLIPARAGAVAPTRIVCLPGVYQAPEDFLAAGFADVIARRQLDIDLLLVDVELAHLGDSGVVARLRRGAVEPARSLGCRTIWLAGISLGGYLALDYVSNHPGELEGVCLLAPWLGNRQLIAAMADASRPIIGAEGDAGDGDVERRLWHFVRSPRGALPELYLGFGHDDRFADAHRLMAHHLTADSVDVVPGGHDWRTWSALWENFLAARFS